MIEHARACDADVVVIGGGPGGAVTACLLAQAGHSVIVVEKDIHPREHVGESLTPSTNAIWQRIGFLHKIEEFGFVHKPGACWTAPRSPVGKFLAIRLNEFPAPGAVQQYTYNVERDMFDAMLLRHAYESGATVLEGARVERVLSEGDRVVGVRVKIAQGWEHDLRCRFVVDASGRRCLLAGQLGLRRRDPAFNQFAAYTWFRGVDPGPSECDGMLFLHFLDLPRAWAWQIPLRNGITSVGVVTDRADFRQAAVSTNDFTAQLLGRNATLAHNLRSACRIRPWSLEGDYSYVVERTTGPGWLLVGDAMRFVDPVFSTGMDVAVYSALHGFEAIQAALQGDDEEIALKEYERRMGQGVDAWYRLISLFYQLQNLFTAFAINKRYRERVVRILQGDLYNPEALARAHDIIAVMEDARQEILTNPTSLLRPGALMGGR